MIFFLLIISTFIHAWTEIISSYGDGLLAESLVAIKGGSLSFNHYFFELFLGIFIPFILLLIGKFKSLPLSALASLFAIIGVFFNRYDSIIGGQLVKVEINIFTST